MNEVKPKLIYKYENFNVQSIKNLKSQSIYFGSPKNFNDPYDCAIRAEIMDPTQEQIKRGCSRLALNLSPLLQY